MAHASHERRMKLGLLTERQQKMETLRHRIDGILGSLREATFVVSSPFDLDGERVEAYARELRQVIREGNALQSSIDELKDELGIED